MLSHLRVIGCFCHASILPRGDKISLKVPPVILLGYSELHKGYILLDISICKIFMSRDVSFIEDVFPRTDAKPNISSSFPALHGSPWEIIHDLYPNMDINN